MMKEISINRQILIIFSIFCTAFILRMVYLSQMNDNPLFVDQICGDSAYYDKVAAMQIEGKWQDETAFLHSPFYRYFLVAIYSMVGRSLDAVRFVQIFLGSISAVLVYLIGKKLFNETVGLAAGILMAIYKTFIFYEGLLLPDSILPFLSLLAILMIIIASESHDYKKWILAGSTLGLCVITRPNVLLFLPFVILWMLIKGKNVWRKSVISTASFILGAGLLILPVTVRNYLIERDFVLVTAAAGLNFYIGNNPYTDGSYYLPEGMGFSIGDPFDDYYGRKIAEKALDGEHLTTSQISDFWLRKGLEFIRNDPGKALILFARKWLLLLYAYEIPQPDDINTYQTFSSLLRLPLPTTAVIMPLGILGILFSIGKRKEVSILYLFMFSYALSIAIFFIVGRYRLPILPILVIFSAYLIYSLVDELKMRRFRVSSAAVLIATLLFVFCNTNPGVNLVQAQGYGTATLTSVPIITESVTPSPPSSPSPSLTPTRPPSITPRPRPSNTPTETLSLITQIGQGGISGFTMTLIFLLGGGVAVALYAYFRISRRKPTTVVSSGRTMAKLILLKGTGRDQEIHIGEQPVTIGSGTANIIQIHDPGISKLHAIIRYAEGNWYLQDQGSRSGTYVNNQKIIATRLNNGDRIRLGSTEFIFTAGIS